MPVGITHVALHTVIIFHDTTHEGHLLDESATHTWPVRYVMRGRVCDDQRDNHHGAGEQQTWRDVETTLTEDSEQGLGFTV